MNKRTIYGGLVTIIFSILISISYFELWGADINVPLTGYRSDSVGVLLEATNYCRGGNPFYNITYNAPEINENKFIGGIHDSSVPMLLIKPLSYLLGSVEAAVNIHAILNVVMLAVSVYFTCIYWKIRPSVAIVMGLLYANLPYFVFSSNTLLLIYSFAFYIPLIVTFLIKVYLGFDNTGIEENERKKRLIEVFLLMFFAGVNSAYYVFFIMILLGSALLYALLHNKDIWGIAQIINSYIAICFGVLCYTLPVVLNSIGLWNEKLNGASYYVIFFIVMFAFMLAVHYLIIKLCNKNSIKIVYNLLLGFLIFILGGLLFIKKFTNFMGQYGGRTLLSVEDGAMKIFHVIMPTINNVFNAINRDVELLVDLENCEFFMMGFIVGIGYLYSILSLHPGKKVKTISDKVIQACGYYNCLITLLSVKGGGAVIFAACLTTGIRNYNRICVFYGLFSIIAFAILTERLISSYIENSENKKICVVKKFIVYTLIIICGGTSIPRNYIYKDTVGLEHYEQRRLEYVEWKEFIQKVEKSVPEGSMILELPLSIDQEYFGKLMEKGRAYELAVPVIVSKTTTWSYGAQLNIKNSVDDVNLFIEEIVNMGFSGIYIDTMLYNDISYKKNIWLLKDKLGNPIICNAGRRYFWSLEEYL